MQKVDETSAGFVLSLQFRTSEGASVERRPKVTVKKTPGPSFSFPSPFPKFSLGGEEEEEEEEEGEYEGEGGKRGERGTRQAGRGASGARVAFAADYEAGQLLSATGRPQRAAATGPKLYVAPAVEGERKKHLLRAGARRSGIDGDEEDDENNEEEEEEEDEEEEAGESWP